MNKKRLLLILLTVIALIVSSIACGGGNTPNEPEDEPVDEPADEPADEPVDEPADEPVDGELDYTLEPNFGEISLDAGFLPDPNLVDVVSGGDIDASYISGCTGYATASPDLRLYYNTDGAGFMRIFFAAYDDMSDATLIVNAPDGSWYCNDDAFGLNPYIDFDDAMSGQYDIWIGSYGSDEFIDGVLGVTEFMTDPYDLLGDSGMTGGDMLDWALDPNFGEVELEAGFSPDPFGVELISGGNLYAGDSVTGCSGYATANPDLWFYWTGNDDFLRIYFEPDAEGDDTTLIINDAVADWYCNDDAYGLNPAIDFSSAPSGWYAIWVGSFSSDELISGTLYFTELSSNP